MSELDAAYVLAVVLGVLVVVWVWGLLIEKERD